MHLQRFGYLVRSIFIFNITKPSIFYFKFPLHIDSPQFFRHQRTFGYIVCAGEKVCLVLMLKADSSHVYSLLLLHIWKRQVKVIILWNKWKLQRYCIILLTIKHRLICTSVTYSKPRCLKREAIRKPRLSRLFSISTVCSVNMTDMLIRVLFRVECGNHWLMHHI